MKNFKKISAIILALVIGLSAVVCASADEVSRNIRVPENIVIKYGYFYNVTITCDDLKDNEILVLYFNNDLTHTKLEEGKPGEKSITYNLDSYSKNYSSTNLSYEMSFYVKIVEDGAEPDAVCVANRYFKADYKYNILLYIIGTIREIFGIEKTIDYAPAA